jgi:hypothetical protein
MTEFQNQPTYDRNPADDLAEQQAQEAAANGVWEAYAQEGAAESAGQIAIQAAAEIETADAPPEQTKEEAQFGFEKSESGTLFVPSASTRTEISESKPFASDVIVTDKRRWTQQTVEADFQKRQEALRAPLENTEISAATEALAAQLLAQEKALPRSNDYKEAKSLERERIALFRINEMAKGKVSQWGHDQNNARRSMTPVERLAAIAKDYEDSRIVNHETDTVVPGGYNGTIYYDFARAADLLTKMQANPAEIRTQLLQPENGIATYPAFLKEPLKAPVQSEQEPVTV